MSSDQVPHKRAPVHVKTEVLTIDQNVNDPKKIITHTGPVLFSSNVTLIRCAKIVLKAGILTLDNSRGNLALEIGEIDTVDPRDQNGVPDDGMHFGGVTGHIGHIIGTGLQGDFGKIGRGSHDLVIDLVDGIAVAYEDPKPKHQDGWQVMEGKNITFRTLNYTGGPNSNHAALFCNPNDPGHTVNDATLIQDVVALGGKVVTKATGIALGACTRCGARNMDITAHFPFHTNEYTVDEINEGNKLKHPTK